MTSRHVADVKIHRIVTGRGDLGACTDFSVTYRLVPRARSYSRIVPLMTNPRSGSYGLDLDSRLDDDDSLFYSLCF